MRLSLLEAIAIRLEAIATRLEAIPILLGWRPSPLGFHYFSQDECSPSFLNRISVAHILLSSSRQARWAWLLLNLLSSVLVLRALLQFWYFFMHKRSIEVFDTSNSCFCCCCCLMLPCFDWAFITKRYERRTKLLVDLLFSHGMTLNRNLC